MDWSKGFSGQYYMTLVDANTWRDIKRIEITGGSVKRESSGLMESADIDCVDYEQGTEKWIRVYLEARQNGDGARIPIFTGLDCTPDASYNGMLKTVSVQCYSVLKPADDIYLDLGWYAPIGFNGAEIIKQLLSVTPAPVNVEGDAPSLKEAIIAEENETHLTMVEKILKAMGWRLRMGGDGTVTICAKAKDPSLIIDPISYDIVEPEISIEHDYFSCPNVFRAIEDDMMAIAKDEDDDSPLSIQNRGREIWMQELSCDLNEDETIAEYAQRRLEEEQENSISVSYSRRFVPDVVSGDVVELFLPQQEISGKYRIDSQTISIGASSVSEKVVKWVKN